MNTRAIRAHIIMAILTPPILIGCWLMLAALHFAHWILSAYQRISRIPEHHLWPVLAALLILLGLLSPLMSRDVDYPPADPFIGKTEFEYNAARFYILLQIATGVMGGGALISFWCLWKMCKVLYRYRRWHNHALRGAASPAMARQAGITRNGEGRAELTSPDVVMLKDQGV